jgi:hypothetical protein
MQSGLKSPDGLLKKQDNKLTPVSGGVCCGEVCGAFSVSRHASRLTLRAFAEERPHELNVEFKAASKAGRFVRFSALQESGHIGDDRLAALTPPGGPRRLTDGKWTSLALPSRYGLDRVDQKPSGRGAATV